MTELEDLMAREQIRHQLAVYCHGVDTSDWELVRSCFADEHEHDHAPFKGTADEFIGFASEVMKSVALSHHSLANIMVNVSEDGLSATSQANFTSVHFIEASAGKALSFATGDEDQDWTVAGRYSDDWVYRDGGWLIIKRKSVHVWDRLEASKKTS